MADLLDACGQFDESLRIHREEHLAVLQRLGDQREAALALGRIAETLHQRGEYAAALALRLDQQLPALQALPEGAVSAADLALAWGGVVQVMQAQGRVLEAIAILRQRRLPLLVGARPRRQLALTLGPIGWQLMLGRQLVHLDLLLGQQQSAGQALQTALLPMAQRMGSERELALVQIHQATCLRWVGRPLEGLALLQQSVLPLFERSSDQRESAFTQARIVEQLAALGRQADLIQICRHTLLPAFERFDAQLELAFTHRQIATAQRRSGRPSAALRRLKQQVLPTLERLNAGLQIAITYTAMARALIAANRVKQALRMLDEQVLTVLTDDEAPMSRDEALLARAEALIELGRAAEALSTLRGLAPPNAAEDPAHRAQLGLIEAHALYRTAAVAEARALLQDSVIPAFAAIGNRHAEQVAQRLLGRMSPSWRACWRATLAQQMRPLYR